MLNKISSVQFSNQTTTVSECCLIKLLPYILFEKYIHILALEMASPGNQHGLNVFRNSIEKFDLSSCSRL